MVKDSEYAYAVARIRANEAKLLTRSIFDQLVSAKDEAAVFDILASNGRYEKAGRDESADEFIKRQQFELWTLLKESVPDEGVLEVFTVQNDFFNLKAALKCSLSSLDPSTFFKQPTSLNTDELSSMAESGDFSGLGEPYAAVAAEAISAANKTENGQMLDMIVDKAALQAMSNCRKVTGDKLTKEIMTFLIGCADIKVAVRSSRTKKPASFALSCLVPCDGLDIEKLAMLTEGEEDELFDYISKTSFTDGAELLRTDSVAFERWVDDSVTEKTQKAKFEFFGFAPIIAYYYAKMNEIKMLKLILSAKQNGLSESTVKERMRQLYV